MSYSLKYFAARGVAESVRVLFAVGKQEFEDYRFPIDLTTFARPEWDAARDAGEYTINMNRLPVLTYRNVDGEEFTFGQTKTIERFVSKKLGLFGANEKEEVFIDMICEHVRDIKQKYSESKAGKKDADLEAAKAKFIAEDLVSWFGKLEKTLTGTDGFAVGSQISLADVAIQQLIRDYFDDLAGAEAAAANYPKLIASADKVQEAAKTYFETRPVTKF